MKSKSMILMFVSLGFGLIAAIGISQVMGNKGTGPAAIKTAPVLVASEFIEISKELSDTVVKIEEWPINIIPENALVSLEQIQNMSTVRAIPKGAPIFQNDIVDKNQQSDINLKGDQRVVFIKVGAESAGNGLLKPGDRVDVIGTFQIGTGPTATTVASTFLKNIEVYSVNETTERKGPREASGAKQNSIVGIVLNKKQGEKLALVQRVGTLTFLMRGKESVSEETEEEDPLPSWLDPEKTAQQAKEAAAPASSGTNSNMGSGLGSFLDRLKPAPSRPAPPETMRIYHGSEKAVFFFNQDGSVFDPAAQPVSSRRLPEKDSNDSAAREDTGLPEDAPNEQPEADSYNKGN